MERVPMVEQVLIELDMVPPDVIISPALQPVFVWRLESVVCRSHDVACLLDVLLDNRGSAKNGLHLTY
jgi:hypothetical protein